MNKKEILYQLIIVIGAALLFIPFIGRVHLFDWDEINFAESAREMIVSGDYLTVQIGFEPFWEKPPLFIWLQVISMKLFGINEFAARFPNAICGILTLLVLYNLGKYLYNKRFGFLWVIAYTGSILPFFYFKSGIIDPWFNLFIFVGVVFWIYAIDNKNARRKYIFCCLSAMLLGLAVLTKGPAAILIFVLLVLVLIMLNGFRTGLNWKQLALFAVTLAFTGGFWFILQILSGNYSIVEEFIVYQMRLFKTQDAGHGGFPLFHFIILFFGVFPASVFAIHGHKYSGIRDLKKVYHTSMIALLWIVLLLFTLVKTKIVHYSSLAYFPITYLAAYSVYQIVSGKYQFRLWQKLILGFTGSMLALIILLLPLFYNNTKIFIDKGWISNPFVIGNLEAETGWNYFHSFIGFILILGLIIMLLYSGRKKIISLLALYGSTMLFVLLSMLFITEGAEKISQHAAIEFIKTKADEDVYIKSFYKSYAVLFYGKQQIPSNRNSFSTQWLTEGNIDKDAFFIQKINRKEEVLQRYPNLRFLYDKNGYAFFERKAIK